MSSTMKDARWQLATAMCEEAEVESSWLTYETFQAVLDAAQRILNEAGQDTVNRLSEKWNQVDA